MICEVTKKHAYFLQKCNYCGRKVSYYGIKSSKIVDKKKRLIICKLCWSFLPSRKAFKSA
ncbi:MAG: hypothetical protein QXF76_01720 [Candidatus Anstonellales archaeon]